MRILLYKEKLLLQIQITLRMTKNWFLKIMHRLFLAFPNIDNALIDNTEDLDVVMPIFQFA